MINTILVKAALKTLERKKWGWRELDDGVFIKRSSVATKCAALVAHDRMLCGELLTRGAPSFYGQKP